MRWSCWLRAVVLGGIALTLATPVLGDEDCKYDFASPTLDGLLQPTKVERMVIVMRNARVETRLAAKALSFEARKRGVQVILMRAPQGASARSLANDEARDKDAQVVALVEVLPGAVLKTASADFRDRAGETIAVLASAPRGSAACGDDDDAALSREGRVVSEVESSEARQALGLGGQSGSGEGTVERPTSEGPDHTWYGWEILLVDAGSALLLLSPEPRLALPLYALGPPTVHALNGQGARAGFSVGLRVLVPLAAAGLGALAAHAGMCSQEGDRGLCTGSVLGGAFITGMVVAAIADDAGLAWKVKEDASDRAIARGAPRSPGLSLRGSVLPLRQGAGVGLSGRF